MITASESRANFWPVLALAVTGILFILSVLHILEAPLPGGWDEAAYFGRAWQDFHAFQEKGLRGVITALRYSESSRPPGYRIPVLPYNMIFGVQGIALKLHALFFWSLTLMLVYGAGKKLAGSAAGGFAVIFLALTPNMVMSSYGFLTEPALYFSIALLMQVLVNMMTDGRQGLLDGLLVTAAVALGGLSKLSFYFLLGPLGLALLVIGWRDARFYPRPLFVLSTFAAGNLLILPWWLTNGRDVLGFTLAVTGTYERHSLGSGVSLQKVIAWINLLGVSALGPAIGMITLLLLAVLLLRFRNFEASRKRTLLLLLFCALPTFWLAFSGTNNNPRYVAPAMFLVALALAAAAADTGWLSAPPKRGLLAVLLLVQFAVMGWPSSGDGRYQQTADSPDRIVSESYRSMYRRLDQWDWTPLREMAAARGMQQPVIGQLGLGRAFHPPGIQLAWIRHHEKPDVRLLWRYEEGPLEWEGLMEKALQCDLLVTAPGYQGEKSGKEPLDNAYNAEFARRIEQSGLFEGPVPLPIGKWETETLAVYFKKK